MNSFKDVVIAWVNGKNVQYRYTPNDEWKDIPHWNPIFEYRVKPIFYKRFLWMTSNNDVAVDIVTQEKELKNPREEWTHFIRWIDTEWQEVEI